MALASLEKLEAQSLQVTEVQKANLKELADVHKQQIGILNNLDQIESQLDRYYQGTPNQHLTQQKIFGELEHQQPKQEKVFEQALQIEQNLSKLDNDVNRCLSMLETTDRCG